MTLVIEQSAHMFKGYPHHSITNSALGKMAEGKFVLCLTFACSGNANSRKIVLLFFWFNTKAASAREAEKKILLFPEAFPSLIFGEL